MFRHILIYLESRIRKQAQEYLWNGSTTASEPELNGVGVKAVFAGCNLDVWNPKGTCLKHVLFTGVKHGCVCFLHELLVEYCQGGCHVVWLASAKKVVGSGFAISADSYCLTCSWFAKVAVNEPHKGERSFWDQRKHSRVSVCVLLVRLRNAHIFSFFVLFI